eukprot:gb/GECH01003693.1/.p1 GENE.gb/GECH01003693.1/~~gb/GECH01003693.1/.p1  ORF type:complete len:413 (+),score=94.95 gb/GECH01003693.1/:1-1239(+)
MSIKTSSDKTQYKTALRKEIIGTFAGLFNSKSCAEDLSLERSPEIDTFGQPVYNLRKHVEWLRSTKDTQRDGFNIEFESLRRAENGMRLNSTCPSATAPENKRKNRYSSVLPNEHTRVKLSQEGAGTDYINANFVNGIEFGIDISYIATQAPLPSTFNDFWQMIWEQQAPVILILANEEPDEDAFRGPCLSKYWPNEDETITYGNISVSSLSQQRYDKDIILRTVQLNKSDGEDGLNVAIIQFVGWPDHGVPSDFKPVRTLFELLDSYNDEITHSRPIVTHCSAGIGRTGTFCTIHVLRLKLQQHLKKYGYEKPFPFNVYSTVKKLKSHRIGMVQTLEQYEFCYEMVLAEAEDLGVKFNKISERKRDVFSKTNGSNSSSKSTNNNNNNQQQQHDLEPPPTPQAGPPKDAFAF